MNGSSMPCIIGNTGHSGSSVTSEGLDGAYAANGTNKSSRLTNVADMARVFVSSTPHQPNPSSVPWSSNWPSLDSMYRIAVVRLDAYECTPRRGCHRPTGAIDYSSVALLLLVPESRYLLTLNTKAGHQSLLPENKCVNVGLERGRGQ
jgi:hypothetical protein